MVGSGTVGGSPVAADVKVTAEEYRDRFTRLGHGNLRRNTELAKRYSSTVTKPLAVRATESSSPWFAGLDPLRQP